MNRPRPRPTSTRSFGSFRSPSRARLGAVVLSAAVAWLGSPPRAGAEDPPLVRLEGRIVDAASDRLLSARVTVEDAAGELHHVRAEKDGRAVPFRKTRGGVVEVHTAVDGGRFVADLPPGGYVLRAERGKEWLPAEIEVVLEAKESETTSVRLPLRRLADLPSRGWYSGETHVHRPLEELPVLMRAEDLHVTFPLTHWVTVAGESPFAEDAEPAEAAPVPVEVEADRFIWPRNTEYEIFEVGGKRHTLGAFFVLGHRSPLVETVPPVSAVGKLAREEGALIDLDKHAWPWSLALVPLLDVDLFELANNHVWRAGFGFTRWGEPPAAWMEIERDADGALTERGWIDYGLLAYYTLLDAGFRLRPTAGTASGVHPVPLGFGRVYVHVEGPLSWESWLRGLDAGRSFVTTGPLLLAKVDGKLPGETFAKAQAGVRRIELECLSEHPLDRIEIVVNGRVSARIEPRNIELSGGGERSEGATVATVTGTSWIAVRAFERLPSGRVRFAHTAPVWIEVEGRPLRPRREEVEWLVAGVSREIERSREAIPAGALAEYERALEVYERLLETAR